MRGSFLTTKDVAAQLELSEATVRRLQVTGLLTPDRVLPGGERQYRQSTIDAFLEKQGWPGPLAPSEAQAQ